MVPSVKDLVLTDPVSPRLQAVVERLDCKVGRIAYTSYCRQDSALICMLGSPAFNEPPLHILLLLQDRRHEQNDNQQPLFVPYGSVLIMIECRANRTGIAGIRTSHTKEQAWDRHSSICFDAASRWYLQWLTSGFRSFH